MSWRDFFKSSHALFLEREVEYYKEQLAQLKISHDREMEHAINQSDKLRDELQRTRILISPGLQGVALPHEHDDDETPPPTTEVVTGTPWQRVRAQMIKDEEARWRDSQAKQAALAKGAKDGVSGQDGEGPSLGKQSTSV